MFTLYLAVKDPLPHSICPFQFVIYIYTSGSRGMAKHQNCIKFSIYKLYMHQNYRFCESKSIFMYIKKPSLQSPSSDVLMAKVSSTSLTIIKIIYSII